MMAGRRCRLPEVGHDRHLRLAHREDGVGRGQADVAGRDEVDAATDAVAVHGGDDRLGAARHRGDGVLELEHVGAGAAGPGRHGRGGAAPLVAGPPPPPVSMPPMALRSRPTEKCGPLAATTTARTAASAPTARPWPGAGPATGPSPMALRASGRSSHTVATRLRRRARCAAPVTRNSAISPMRRRLIAPGREPSGGPVECMGRIGAPERGRRPCTPSPPRLPRPWPDRTGSVERRAAGYEAFASMRAALARARRSGATRPSTTWTSTTSRRPAADGAGVRRATSCWPR